MSSKIFPRDDQAVVIFPVEEIEIEECLNALGKIVGLSSIQYVSDIMEKEVFVYLDTRSAVVELVKKLSTILVNDKVLYIRRLIVPKKRIIISNVPPSIPHETIEQFFRINNIRVTSDLKFMKADLQDPKHTHICSFKREVFVQPEDTNKVPHTFYVTHEGKQHQVNARIDTVNLFNSKQERYAVSTRPKSKETVENSQ